MHIEQFYDDALAHASYLVEHQGQAVLIDPERNPAKYLAYIQRKGLKLIGLIETHPHADFISSHLEFHHRFGIPLYCSKLVGAEYPHSTFDEGDQIAWEGLVLRAMNTPGHSPDSICVVLEQDGKTHAVFTGDTLFVGDVGRPDLRENAGNIQAKKEELAKAMYHSLRDKLMKLPDHTLVYPAHGSGSLCGRALSNARHSTIGAEKVQNYAMQDMSEEEFVTELLKDQPFMPRYFGPAVAMNKQGAPSFDETLKTIHFKGQLPLDGLSDCIVLDTRPQNSFKEAHVPGSWNLMNGGKFETWLGSILDPGDAFVLVAESQDLLWELAGRVLKIGYEKGLKGLYLPAASMSEKEESPDVAHFSKEQDSYVVLDVRNNSELVQDGPDFSSAIHIPLPELKDRWREVPDHKPVMVHCAGGYRSAAASSMLNAHGVKAFDLGQAILEIRRSKSAMA